MHFCRPCVIIFVCIVSRSRYGHGPAVRKLSHEAVSSKESHLHCVRFCLRVILLGCLFFCLLARTVVFKLVSVSSTKWGRHQHAGRKAQRSKQERHQRSSAANSWCPPKAGQKGMRKKPGIKANERRIKPCISRLGCLRPGSKSRYAALESLKKDRSDSTDLEILESYPPAA